MMQYRLQKCILSVIGGFLTHLSLGAYYLWGNVSLYATSYYRLHGHPNLLNSTMQFVFPFIFIGICLGQFNGVLVARKIGHMLTSGIIISVYGLAVYLASISNFYGFVITMGVVSGFCVGNEYLIPVDNAYYYYPERKGLMSGLILCGLGFSAVVFNPLVQHLINPNGESPTVEEDGHSYYTPEVANNLPGALWKMSLIYFSIGIVGVLMMQQTKEYVEAEMNRDGNITEQMIENDKQSMQRNDLKKSKKNTTTMDLENTESIDNGKIIVSTTKDLFLNKDIYILFGLLYLCTGFGLMSASNYKTYGLQNIEHDDNYFVVVGSLGAAANGLSRFFWSALLDYISPNTLLFINICLIIILSSTLNVICHDKIIYCIWIVLIYFEYGGLFTYFPTVCTRLYGPEFGPYAWNIIFIAVVSSNFTQFFLVLYAEKHIGYRGILHIYTAFGGAALILLLFYSFIQRKESNPQKVRLSNNHNKSIQQEQEFD